MTTDRPQPGPESSAVRVALWRALHVELDPPPHVLEDDVGLRLAAPDEGWRARRDMDPRATSSNRASIVARARFIEDLVEARAADGVRQYVLLGAGLDTFAQRRPELASTLAVFEVDQAGPQAWKRARLLELGYGAPRWLTFVPADFEAGGTWWDALAAAGFDAKAPALFTSTGVSMYVSREATMTTLRRLAGLAPGSTVAMSYMPPLDLVAPHDRPAREAAERGARASGTPFVSFYTPAEVVALAREAGFGRAEHVSAASLEARYFAGRTDGLRPSTSEELLVATV